MSFLQELQSQPKEFYILLGLSGVNAYFWKKNIQNKPLASAISSVSSSLIQYYAYKYVKTEPEQEPIPEPGEFDHLL